MATLQNIYAPSPSTTRGQPSVLSVDPKGQSLLYTCGKNVIIRNIANPLICDIYTEHARDATVAKYSPSGYYIASGDVSGKIRIWDTVNKEHILKIELSVISGAIADLAWSQDSQRIVVVGDGRESFAKVFVWDSGTTVGEISGHAKRLISCDFKQSRPFRIASGGEDSQVNFFEGPPFKFKLANRQHTKFVNCIRYSPDGKMFLSVGSDCKGYFYDGGSGEVIGELRGEQHTGSIYSCSFDPQSTRVVTASADKTIKMWEAGSGTLLGTFTVADAPTTDHMQMAVLWTSSYIFSLSLNGDLNVFNPATFGLPIQVLKGHNKSISALTYDRATNSLFSASFDANLNRFEVGRGNTGNMQGKGHTNQITAVAVVGGKLITCAMDDTLRISSADSMAWSGSSIPLGGPGADISVNPANPNEIAVVTQSSIQIVVGDKVVSQVSAPFKPNAVAYHPSGSSLLVAADDKSIRVFNVAGASLTETTSLQQHRGQVTCVRYSPCGRYFASADANREVIVWNAADNSVLHKDWVFHTSRITCLEWSDDSVHIATGSLDSNVIVWDITNPSKRIEIRGAHSGGVSGVCFVAPNVVASGGADCALKTWTF